MELDSKKIGLFVKKSLVLLIRFCCRSAYDHPFVLGMVISCFLLYRFLPALFAFLVSSSPVIFCTAVLLGTLLSFGNPNIPEVEQEEEEKEEKRTNEVSSLKAGSVADDIVVKKDEGVATEASVERREIDHKATDEVGKENIEVGKLEKDAVSLVDLDVGGGADKCFSSWAVVVEDEEIVHHREKEIEENLHVEQEFVDKREFPENEIKLHVSDTGEAVGSCWIDGKEMKEGPGDEALYTLVEDHFGSSLRHDESESESDSDRAESSSPDASMADIMPMLDELHPLLDTEAPDAPQPVHIPIDDSDAGFQESDHESDEGSAESAEDAENREEVHGDNEDKTESIVKWTEDDQKNLMDLGTSELERNRRLENLIAKRMARKHQRMAFEKNLIDLESHDMQTTMPMSGGLEHIPLQIPPISTARRNPFDLPYESNGSGGLPPLPGSAPSVLLPRRNPFDLPFDTEDERGNLMMRGTSSYEVESFSTQQREFHFHRHESFTFGEIYTMENKQDKHDIKFEPYFVPEGIVSGERSHAPFQRQLSEISESKVSSVPDTDSVSSVEEQEQEHTVIEESHREGKIISSIDASSKLVGQQSDSSEAHHVEIERDESGTYDIDVHNVNLHASEIIEEAHHGTSNEQETIPPASSINKDYIPSLEMPNAGELDGKSEVVEENYESSSTSLLGANEKPFELDVDEEFEIRQTSADSQRGSSETSKPAHVEGDHGGHVEVPVYDLSPAGTEKSLSNMIDTLDDLFRADRAVFSSTSSIASDTHVESLDKHVELLDKSVTTTVERSFSPLIESVSSSDSLLVVSSALPAVDENNVQTRELTGMDRCNVQDDFAEVHHNHDISIEPRVPESVVEHDLHPSDDGSVKPMVPEPVVGQASEGLSSLSVDKQIEGELAHDKLNHLFKGAETPDEEVCIVGHQVDMDVKMDVAAVIHSQELFSNSYVAESEVLVSLEGTLGRTQDSASLQTHAPEKLSDTNTAPELAKDSDDTILSKETYTSMDIAESLREELSEGDSIRSLIDLREDAFQHDREVGEKLITEEEDVEGMIKEIDFGLLSELDTVGDFSTKEPASLEKYLSTVEEFDEIAHVDISTDASNQIEENETIPYRHEDVETQLAADKLKSAELESVSEENEKVDIEPKERNSALHVLEATSLADIDLAFKKFQEVDAEKLVGLECGDDKSVSVMAEVGSSQLELEERVLDLNEIDLALHVFEARSIEDIDSAFKLFLERDAAKPMPIRLVDDEPYLGESGYDSPELNRNGVEKRQDDSELHGIEASSLEDLNSRFKQLFGGNSGAVSSIESTNNEPMPDVVKTASSEPSPEDPDFALEHSNITTAEKSIDETPQLLNAEIGIAESTELQKYHANSLEGSPPNTVLKAQPVGDIDSDFKPMHGGEVESSAHVESPTINIDSELETNLVVETQSYPDEFEARSLSDIDLTINQFRESHMKAFSGVSASNEPQLLESSQSESYEKIIDSSSVQLDLSESKTSELQNVPTESLPSENHLQSNDIHADLDSVVSEARAHEYSDSPSSELHEHHRKPVSYEPASEKVHVESEVGSSDKDALELSEDYSSVLVPEEKCIEAIQLDLKQVLEGSVENPPKPKESEDKPADFEAIERHLEPIILMRSSQEIEAALKESAARESSTGAERTYAAASKKGIKETCDDSSSRREEGSRKSSLTSSSSSSSSSSDSE